MGRCKAVGEGQPGSYVSSRDYLVIISLKNWDILG